EQIRFLPVFLTLNFLGCLLMISLVSISLFSSRIHHHAVLLNFYVVWIPYTFCYTLLFISGHVTGPEPSELFCTVQAGLVYGAPAMASTATLALIYLVSVRVTYSFKADSKALPRWTSCNAPVLLVVPYVAFTIFFLTAVVAGFKRPDLVGRNRYLYYCTVDISIGQISTAYIGLQCFIGLALQGWAAIPVWKHRKALWAMRNRDSTERDGICVRLLVRLVIFSAYLVFEIVLCLCLFTTKDPSKTFGLLNISLATLPVAVAVVLGSKDFFEVLGCHRHRHRHRTEQSDENVLTTVMITRPEQESVRTSSNIATVHSSA
ncbi:hypothetical protein SISNIDRAFT_450567, partial [Sistotremastrum niveocremeum HHB9708]